MTRRKGETHAEHYSRIKDQHNRSDSRFGNLRAFRARIRRYGLTFEAYEALYDAQGGVCAICRTLAQKRALAVDHDHATGQVRALLCSRCNVVLGMARDNPETLRAAIAYLGRFR